MTFSQIVGLLSGVALFLFGMGLMGDGLKQVSGSRLEPILFRLSGTQFRGVLLGAGVTAVIQSSSATSVMVVGFVNSGMMKVRQAIGVILGAILGTSITGWIICLSYLDGGTGLSGALSTATLSGVVAVIGIFLRMAGKSRTQREIGNILMGFAILMFGMSTMGNSVSTLGEQAWFLDVMTSLAHPLLGILVGAAFTALLQSASASVGIIQALSVTGVFTLDEALPLLMGVAVGASLPVLLSALGAGIDGRRTAFVYLLATMLGTAVCAALFYILDVIFRFPFMEMVMNPFSIAAANTILRLAMVCLLLPFTDVLEAEVKLLVRDRRGAEEDPGLRLEERFLAHPALAIEQSRATINAMADRADAAIEAALALLTDYSEAGYKRVEALEDLVDRYEDVLGSYLVKLTARELTERQSREASKFLHTLSDFERISDHALNIAENAKEIHEKKLVFSEGALHEMAVLRAAVREVVGMTTGAFAANDLSGAARVEPLEEVIDDICDEMKLRHIERLQQGRCTIVNGFVFNDIITNCERVSDHCSNVAVAMIELNIGEFDTHAYLGQIREKRSPDFERHFNGYRERFSLSEK